MPVSGDAGIFELDDQPSYPPILTTRENIDRLIVIQSLDRAGQPMDREQAERADLRLAYVQHPVPAQGVTTDTTHLIVAEHTTAEGTYVALTRAREQTHIHVSEELLLDSELEPLERLAERVGRSEPELPSIAVPLRPERGIEREHDQATPQLERDRSPGWEIG